MKKTIICTGIAPALTVSDKPALRLLDPESDIRVLQAGYSVLILSSLKWDEWNRILQESPELLRITDDRGQCVFRISFDNEGPGSVLEDQVIFGNVVTGEGFATITLLLEAEPDSDPAQVLLSTLGTGLTRLAEAEQTALILLLGKDTASRKIRSRIVRL